MARGITLNLQWTGLDIRLGLAALVREFGVGARAAA
jgi:hypothetical protein